MGQTEHQDLPFPESTDDVKDFPPEFEAFANLMDAFITATLASLALKAALTHTHAFDDIPGLRSALEGKADAVHNHLLASLTDVTGAAAAAEGYILAKTADGKFAFGSPASLLGNHGHTIAQIQNLSEALAAKATPVDIADAIAALGLKSMSKSQLTVTTGAPTGGADGDIHFKL